MDRKEKIKHSSASKPYSYYRCEIPNFFSCVPLHWHKELEINYIRSGIAEFIIDDESFVAEAGDVVFISSESLHSIYSRGSDNLNYDTIVFSMDLLDAMGNDRSYTEILKYIASGALKIQSHIDKKHTVHEEIKRSAEVIFECVKENSAEYDMLLKSELFRILFYLHKNRCIYKGKKITSPSSAIVRPVIEYIEENFAETISVEELANLVHLSKSYFMNRFKAAVGIGAAEYICQIRIKRACDMLRSSETNVAEIAFECGFKNLSNFNRQFKTALGATPLEYRKMHQS